MGFHKLPCSTHRCALICIFSWWFSWCWYVYITFWLHYETHHWIHCECTPYAIFDLYGWSHKHPVYKKLYWYIIQISPLQHSTTKTKYIVEIEHIDALSYVFSLDGFVVFVNNKFSSSLFFHNSVLAMLLLFGFVLNNVVVLSCCSHFAASNNKHVQPELDRSSGWGC